MESRAGATIWQSLQDIEREAEEAIASTVNTAIYAPLRKYADKLHEIALRSHRSFKLGVVGEFKAGKSSLINELIGEEIALIDELEMTATLNRYVYDNVRQATIIYSNSTTEVISIDEANERLKARKEDVAWLSTVHSVTFSASNAVLSRMEFWDSPGLGGSDFNDGVAQMFVDEVDAVIWVFDCNYLGNGNLSDTLDKLIRRGKPIFAVVNKSEDLSIAEFQRDDDLLKRSYASVQFAQLIHFSALMAKEARLGVPESVYDGDLPADGGRASLLCLLENEVFCDPDQITAKSAAGDFRSCLVSAEDEILQASSGLRRSLWIAQEQRRTIGESLRDKISLLFDESVCSGLARSLYDGWMTEARGRIEKANSKSLASIDWIAGQAEDIIKMTARDIAKQFVDCAKDGFKTQLIGLGLDEVAALDAMLLPLERDSVERVPRAADISKLLGPIEANIGDPSIAGWTEVASFAGVVAAALGFIDLGILTAVGSFIVRLLSARAAKAVVGDEAALKDVCTNNFALVFGNQSKRIADSYSARCKSDVLSVSDKYVDKLVTKQEQSILRGESFEAVSLRVQTFGAVAQTLNSLANRTSVVAGLRINEKSTVLRTTRHIAAGEREGIKQVFDAIKSETPVKYMITDRKFAHSLFDTFLLDLQTNVTIRIITLDEPTTDGLADVFRDRLQECRAKRDGAVSVVVPQSTLSSSAGPSISLNDLPTSAWIFTDKGAYEFSEPLSIVLSGKKDFIFTPHDDYSEALHQQFQRWWSGSVKGYNAVQIV
ncbi:MAG: dynamin family protein [Capsulimonadaceae bacterium]|nr:dynamin family protein [Capsulimonadaceae bacterium]